MYIFAPGMSFFPPSRSAACRASTGQQHLMLVSHNLNIICAAKRRGREARKGVSINDIATVFNAKRISLISVNIT